MKRIGRLFDRAISFEHLWRSFHLARRGCGNTEDVCRFFFRLEPELLRLREELQDGSYRPGAYRYFRIRDPKERTIAVAPFRDRVVHHAIVGVLSPIYERVFIYDSYATRPGKGTHKAILRAQHFLRRWRFSLKFDIRKYFDSVDHDILLAIVSRKIKDPRLLALLERIVRNTPVPGKGLPIGNLTSQFLANVYLDPFDHMLKETLRIKGYLRYMDDFAVFGNEKAPLLELRSTLDLWLKEHLRLTLKPEATLLQASSQGLNFLGMRIYPRFMRIKPENRRRSLRKIQQRIRDWRAGKITEEQMQHSLESIQGHLRYFCPAMPLI